MNGTKMVAALLIVCGTIALGYGGFGVTPQTQLADVGPVHLSVDQKQQVNLPAWGGMAAILLGGFLFVWHRKA